ncbi:MAG: polyhydroxybutyrate depolymerase [Myxococcota bacterium]|jgi:polyhydroxybutyrate depolymerase
MLSLLLACTGATPDDAVDDTLDTTDTSTTASPGCGIATELPGGGVQLILDAGDAGDGERSYWLSLPDDYDPNVPHTLTIGYAGTDWVGEQIQPYLDLEDGGGAAEIYVYPDPLWRAFEGWGTYGGWVLGDNAQPADGMGDLNFTAALLDDLEASLCIDTDRVFATGHSWGGDMAQVVSCFLGDRITASVPVAANRPYWFEESGSWSECVGDTAVWTMFGINDDHFTWQDYPGEYGDECRDFWLDTRSCEASSTDLGYGADGECVSYDGCDSEVRYCLYGPQTGHQIPGYFSEAALAFFRGF